MSDFTKLLLSFVAMAFIGRFCLFTNDSEFRNNKIYNIFIICSGLISLILVIILGFNVLKFILSAIQFLKDVF